MLRSQNYQQIICVIGLIVSLAMSGCGRNSITKSNYERVKEGMTLKEVEAILGAGREQASTDLSVPGMDVGGVSVSGMSMSGQSVMWQDGTKVISVTIMNGKVLAKAQFGL